MVMMSVLQSCILALLNHQGNAVGKSPVLAD